ncbi:NAD-dependent protein deacetylase Sir2B-like [Aphis craccivora]|uniref:NAD-dependent protein deacetylase Sir2B-like n=1 Tax=Aphis craccivora TaxID=307492 RepID=A0A6G0VZ44_APHCR|nr:NAD-dependent protein deacetylase Sir2B-like [Aphis craccivora]
MLIENGEQVKPKLKYNYFANYEYFNRNFNISFGIPRSDTRQTCDNLKRAGIGKSHFCIYPELGHSFLPCDRCFGHIEKVRRKVKRVFLLDEYEKMVSLTNKKFKVVHVDQSLKKVITNKEKVKFTIMAYRYVEYTKEGIVYSTSGNSTAKEKYILNKTGEELTK